MLWRICQDGLSVTGAAAAVPMPLMHTVELNAGHHRHRHRPAAARQLDVGAVGAGSRAGQPAEPVVVRCPGRHLRACAAGGGGLTPSDIAPARLSQQQIDELAAAIPDRRRSAADPAAAGTAVPRQHRAGRRRCVCGAAGYHVDRPARPAPAARCGARGGHPASATWRPDSANSSTSRCRSSRPIRWRPGGMSSWTMPTSMPSMSMSRSQRVCAAERAAVCDLADQPAFRAALIRIAADRHRFVLTNHHIVLDGWSLPILLREIFASYHGQRLAAAGPYRRFVTWLADRDLDAARAAWGEVLAGFDTPTLVGPPGRLEQGRRGVASFRVPEQTTRAAQRAGALVSDHRQHRAAGRLRAAADAR